MFRYRQNVESFSGYLMTGWGFFFSYKVQSPEQATSTVHKHPLELMSQFLFSFYDRMM